jgi:hypothetical protein
VDHYANVVLTAEGQCWRMVLPAGTVAVMEAHHEAATFVHRTTCIPFSGGAFVMNGRLGSATT